jgi:hypothetical protein
MSSNATLDSANNQRLKIFSVPLLWPTVAADPHFIHMVPFILPIAHIGMTGIQ